jgi:CubicO group peptidase (beta-lactamase class C family)
MLKRCVDEGLVPGVAAAAGTAAQTLRREHYGAAQIIPERRPMPPDAIFDVASLTKIVVTTTLALRYVERGLLYLDQRVASILPAFGAAGKDGVTLRHLLTHTAGLPAWTRLSEQGHGRDGALEAVCQAPLERPVESAVVYSDLGYIILGAVLATAGGAPLDELAQREVFEPLGMTSTMFRPSPALRARCVATEVVPERGGAIVGTVHDENAAALGGVCGHAGLFSTCQDLERFCRMWLGGGVLDGRRFLSEATVRAATRDQTGWRHPARRRGLGWVLQPNPLWVPADLCSPAAYSHTGFTGTSLLIDPEYDLFTVLLTNRVHPTRGDQSAERIRTVRARFHNAVWAALAR